jgi:hypothetical protein
MGQRLGIFRFLVGKPEGKRPLGRPMCRWEDNIKMGLQDVGGTCECDNEPSGSIQCREFLD